MIEPAALLTVLAGVATVALGWVGYRLDARRRADEWIRLLRERHERFWNDPEMIQVRAWINYDTAYADLRPALEKRARIAARELDQSELTREECAQLDTLDRFFNLALEIRALGRNLKVRFQQEFWEELWFDYWARRRIYDDPKRVALCWYVGRFYPELLNPNLAPGSVKQDPNWIDKTYGPDSAVGATEAQSSAVPRSRHFRRRSVSAPRERTAVS